MKTLTIEELNYLKNSTKFNSLKGMEGNKNSLFFWQSGKKLNSVGEKKRKKRKVQINERINLIFVFSYLF